MRPRYRALPHNRCRENGVLAISTLTQPIPRRAVAITILALVLCLVMLSLGVGFSMAANAAYYSICTDLFPNDAAAATGIMVTFFSVSGLVTPILTGWLSDNFGGFDSAFMALAGFVTTGALGMLLFARPGTAIQDTAP